MLTSIILYLILGSFVGVFAGLLGVGGGLVIVPLLSYSFALQGFKGEYLHHMALGTSLATIMFTSISSFMAHHRNGAVIWAIVRSITPGIILGALLGSRVVAHLPTTLLKGFFVMFLLYVGIQLKLDIKPKASREIPGFLGNSVAGGIIGAVSSFVGIGGGTMSIPYMVWCNVPMHKAIGTSAAIGFPIALGGAAGFLINGLGIPGLPGPHLGFIYLPALIGIAAASMCTAPLGAKLSHKLPVLKLKKVFAVLLFLVAVHMIYSIYTAL